MTYREAISRATEAASGDMPSSEAGWRRSPPVSSVRVFRRAWPRCISRSASLRLRRSAGSKVMPEVTSCGLMPALPRGLLHPLARPLPVADDVQRRLRRDEAGFGVLEIFRARHVDAVGDDDE